MGKEDPKPKARFTLKPVREEDQGSPAPQAKFSASKPTVRNAVRRKPSPGKQEPRKPVKGSRKPSAKAPKATPTESPATVRFRNAAKSSSPENEHGSNPTNANLMVNEEKTIDQMLDDLVGSFGKSIETINANLKGRRPKITQLKERTLKHITLMVKAGAYHKDAARAAGVTDCTWRRWLDRGKRDFERNKNTVFCQLFRVIDKAEGEALVIHSVRAVQDDPKFFLTHGPGKSRPGREGWSPSIKIEGGTDPIQVEHNHNGRIEIEGSPHLNISLGKPEGSELIAQAFAGLTEIGVAIPKHLLESAKPALDAEITEAVKKAVKKG